MAKHLIITVHGILTSVSWQPKLRQALLEVEPDAVVHDYGFLTVSPLALMRGRREPRARKFSEELLAEMTRIEWGRIDIVAHSFGTYIVVEALAHLVRTRGAASLPKIHTLVLAGSVLATSYPLRRIVPMPVRRVVNDCGLHDTDLWLARLIFPGLGFAGRVGFEGLCGHDVVNRYFPFAHGDYFPEMESGTRSSDFMRKWWLPLLTRDEEIVEHDARVARRFQILIAWLERQATLWRIAVVCLALVLLMSIPLAIVVHENHVLRAHNRELTAQRWANDSERLSGRDPIAAAKLAIASALIEPSARSDANLETLLEASALPEAQLSAWNRGGGFLVAVSPNGDLAAEARADNSGNAVVHLTSLPRAASQRDIEVSMTGCAPRRQPLRVRFSPSGQHLVLETMFGSCILDTSTATWRSSLPAYTNVVFTADERGWFASLVAFPEPVIDRASAPAIYADEGRREDVVGFVHAGWLESAIRLGASGSAFVDSMGVAWTVGADHVASRLRAPELDDEHIARLAASEDGNLLAISTASAKLVMVDMSSRSVKWQQWVKKPLSNIVFSQSSGRLGILLDDGTASVLAANNGATVGDFNGEGFPLEIAFLDDVGDRLLTINRDAPPKVWNVPSKALAVRIPLPVFSDHYSFDRTGQAIAVASADGTTTIWNASWRTDSRQMSLAEGIDAVQLGGSGRFVAVLGRHGSTRLWDTATAHEILDIDGNTTDGIEWRSTLAVSDNGQTVAMLDDSAILRAWRPSRGEIFRLKLPREFAESVDVTTSTVRRWLPHGTDGRVMSSCDGALAVEDRTQDEPVAMTAAVRRCALNEGDAWVEHPMAADLWNSKAPLALSPDGRLLAVLVLGDLLVFDVDSGNVVRHWRLPYETRKDGLVHDLASVGPPMLGSLAFGDDGRRLFAQTKNDPWSGLRGGALFSFSVSEPESASSTFRLEPGEVPLGQPIGTRGLVSIRASANEILVRNAATFALARRLHVEGKVDLVDDAYWHPHTLLVASHREPKTGQPISRSDEDVDVYELPSLTLKHHLSLTVAANWMSLMPDESRLMLLDSTRTARIVDVESGELTSEYELSTSPKAVWFGPDGTFFYTSGTSLQYEASMAGDGNIFTLRPAMAGELIPLLCKTLRATDRDFRSLEQQIDLQIKCPG